MLIWGRREKEKVENGKETVSKDEDTGEMIKNMNDVVLDCFLEIA